MKSIYISGKISGTNDYKSRFNRAEMKLNREGWWAVNPLTASEKLEKEMFPNVPSWSQYMRADIKLLLDCDAIYMMKGWEKSTGAKLEHHIAKSLFKIIVYEV